MMPLLAYELIRIVQEWSIEAERRCVAFDTGEIDA